MFVRKSKQGQKVAGVGLGAWLVRMTTHSQSSLPGPPSLLLESTSVPLSALGVCFTSLP